MNCGVGPRNSLDSTLLWLWCRPANAAPIGHLAWEPPYAVGAALEKKQKTKENIDNSKCCWRYRQTNTHTCWGTCQLTYSCWKTVWQFLQNYMCNYSTTKQLNFGIFIPEKWRLTFTQKPVGKCSEQLYS